MPAPDHQVTLITRAGCHLCELAEATLRRLSAELGFGYAEVDVDGDPARRAEVRVFADWFNRVWKRAPNEIADHGPTDALSAEMRAHVEVFEALLQGRDYLFGDFGLADVTAFPFLKYAVLGLPPDDDEVFHRVLVDYQPLRDDSPLHAWVLCVDAHPRG